ncbi:MAG: histidine phosphatase family protein [Phycisphaerae bacterium]|jgi:phosphohistidine phosphatase SixA
MKIILIRHGESEHNAKLSEDKDSPLTKKGKKQAEYLGKKLKKLNISKIYVSKMIRAKETAEIISKKINAPIKEEFEELNEYDSTILRSKLKIFFNKRIKKLKKLLNSISKDKGKEEIILIIAHGITNRIIISHLLEFPLRKQILRFKQDNTGISVIEWNEDYQNWALHSMNDISHLNKVNKRLN